VTEKLMQLECHTSEIQTRNVNRLKTFVWKFLY